MFHIDDLDQHLNLIFHEFDRIMTFIKWALTAKSLAEFFQKWKLKQAEKAKASEADKATD